MCVCAVVVSVGLDAWLTPGFSAAGGAIVTDLARPHR